jgi:hypothetical protein
MITMIVTKSHRNHAERAPALARVYLITVTTISTDAYTSTHALGLRASSQTKKFNRPSKGFANHHLYSRLHTTLRSKDTKSQLNQATRSIHTSAN